MSDLARLRAKVSGRVQGVGFRYFVQKVASELGLSGFVRNLATGDVELEAEGTASALDQLVVVLQGGPPLSRVDEVVVTDCPTSGEPVGFRVSY